MLTGACIPPDWAWSLLQGPEAGALGSPGNTVLLVTGARLGLWALWGAARLPSPVFGVRALGTRQCH